MNTTRHLERIIPALSTTDGAGVKLRRSLGQKRGLYLDPFLMLDEFSSDIPDDYIAGFPPHPHRGFETVTYMLEGQMRHEDHLGNIGELKSGGVQWMTAGHGIVHSEMPQQTEGSLRGFQLWINLPAREKMKPASYRDIQAADIPVLSLAGGIQIKVIAGTLIHDDKSTLGPIQGLSTDPLFLDVRLPAGMRWAHPIAAGYQAFIYPYEGSVQIAPKQTDTLLETHQAGVLSPGDTVEVESGAQGTRFLLLAGRPLNEPIAQYGPFVMNTQAELEQAIADYKNGTLTAEPITLASLASDNKN